MTHPTAFEQHLAGFTPQLGRMAQSRACWCADACDLAQDAEDELCPDEEQNQLSPSEEYAILLRNAKAFVAELAQGSRTPHGAALCIRSLEPGYERTARRIAMGEIGEPEAAELVAYWRTVYLPALQQIARQC